MRGQHESVARHRLSLGLPAAALCDLTTMPPPDNYPDREDASVWDVNENRKIADFFLIGGIETIKDHMMNISYCWVLKPEYLDQSPSNFYDSVDRCFDSAERVKKAIDTSSWQHGANLSQPTWMARRSNRLLQYK